MATVPQIKKSITTNNTLPVKVYGIKRISESGHKGWNFIYATKLAPNGHFNYPISYTAISTEKEANIWEEDLEKAFSEFCGNYGY